MKTALRLRLWSFIFLLFPLVTSAAELDFKGIPMGSSERVVKAKFPWLKCKNTTKDERASGDRTCDEPDRRSWKGTFAGAPAGLSFDFYTDKLHRILIIVRENNFDAAIEALTAKYGTPIKTETKILQNQMGATFPNHTYIWRLEGGTITAEHYGLLPTTSGTLITNFSSIVYSTDYAKQEYARRKYPEQEKSKKDL